MTDVSYKKWLSMRDDALIKQVGIFIKHHRLGQNKTQEQVAEDAGISRSTLSLLERGEAVTLPTLIQVLRVLDQLQVMEAFEIQQSISPLALAKAEKEKRKRARNTQTNNGEESNW
ncbi:MAG: helix-turn-helix transcriptional regulator [Bacteroidetes bacterium]|nr:helix-turn-helix transcriptional regulator [Bacteroidota bacterium]